MARGQMEHGIALDVARREIAARIHRFCEQFDEAEFEKLVDQMAQIEVKYRLRDDRAFLDAIRNSEIHAH